MRCRIGAIRAESERGMLSMVMLVAIIGTALGALLIPIVVSQSHSTAHSDSRVQALHGAQAGIDAMLGRLRKSALPTDPNAVTGLFTTPSNLPCSPLVGTEPGSATMAYNVTITYDNLGPGICPTSTPKKATITSTGTDTASGSTSTRVLTTTYSFSSVSYNVQATTSGGQIRLDPLAKALPASGTPQCLDAGAMRIGVTLTVADCFTSLKTATPGGYQQLFFYEPDLSLRMFYSVSQGNPNGLCLDNTSGVTLQQCQPVGSAPATQQWSLKAFVNLVYADNSFVTSDGKSCLTAVGATVAVATCKPLNYDPAAAWAPTPSAGVGAAGAGAGQLASLSQAGRCAQAMNADGSNTPPTAMVVLYTCEQQLAPAQVGWYQHFTYNVASQQWSTTYSGNGLSYCLTSNGPAGGPVAVTACSASPFQKWTQQGVALGDPGDPTAPATQYAVRDNSNLCLVVSPSQTYTSVATGVPYNVLATATCTTATDNNGASRADPSQEWNANQGQQSTVATHTTEQ